ncbi:MAG TPA: Ppx/GppA phosphatase family protein [Nocardioidaceae bacterium]|nr:Ppx/GppA phosphatase family protein [Nocardioidaceae bacterium]
MRLGVLDIGSNTGHLLVVDAHGGAAPMPAYSYKEPLRLAAHLDDDGALSDDGIDALTSFVSSALGFAEDKGCEEVIGFATSAVRDAGNSDAVLGRVREETGVRVSVLPGEDEARLTFLAVRRWFGWSSGRLAVFDIGGGSLEVAVGADEAPDVAWSLPLGAGRLTRDWLPEEDPPSESSVRQLRKKIRADVAQDAGSVLRGGAPDRAVGTSKTFRSLARVCGAAPYAEGMLVRRVLDAAALRAMLPSLAAMTAAERTHLPGVSASRADQLLAGALVADAVLDLFELAELEICPWALREGVILERLDQISVLGA